MQMCTKVTLSTFYTTMTVEICVLLPRPELFFRGTLIAAKTGPGSWRLYCTASVGRALLLLLLLRALDTALCFCRW